MDFGVNTWVWTANLTTADLPGVIETVERMGFDRIELPLEDHGDLDFARAGELIRDAGLEVSTAAVMTEPRDLVHPDGERRETGRAYLRDAITATDTMGGDRLVGPMYAATGRRWQMSEADRAEIETQLIETLADLSTVAADHGVTLCLEPLNRFETSLINTVTQAQRILSRVDHDACQLLLDTFHLNIEEQSIPAAIRAADDQLAHVHACANDRGTPGSGHIPWDEVAAALADIGYDGPIVIESFTPAVDSIASAAAVWRALAPSQDDLARDGLAHLRATLDPSSSR